MDIATMRAALPGLDDGRARQMHPPMEGAMREFQITSAMRSAMWLAQIGHESNSLRWMEELASGAAYEGRRDLGNTQRGDGVRFKGRGPIQLTGRANYTRAGQALKLNLVGNPGLAAQPQHAFRVSAWWWKTHGLNEISDRGDVLGATRRINGGTNGLNDRRRRYDIACRLGDRVIPGGARPSQLQPSGGAPRQNVTFSRHRNPRHGDVRVWQAKMKQRGWRIDVDGVFGPQSEGVAKGLQRNRGLQRDGIVGPRTWQATWGPGGGPTTPG